MNVYQQLQNLIPKSSLIIAVVQSENGDGTTLCSTLDGQSILARGVAGRFQGVNVFVEIDPFLGLSITGDAPSMAAYSIEV